ncbi:MAG: formate/nitrite transporter family protein [Arcanobacterium sp.]
METLTQSIDRTAETGLSKAIKSRNVFGYLMGGALAGAFVGLGVTFMFTGPAAHYVAGSEWTQLLMGGVFGIGLIFIVFGGGELTTSGMMIMPIAAIKQRVSWLQATLTLLAMMVGNFIGSVTIALLTTYANVYKDGSDPGIMLDGVLAGKIDKSNTEIFFRAIMCNILVCLAIWTTTRMKNEIAISLVLAWAITAFVAGGFEHVVANMTTFSLGLLNDAGGTTVFEMGRNLLFAFLGNLTGGGLFIGGSFLLATQMEKEPANTGA